MKASSFYDLRLIVGIRAECYLVFCNNTMEEMPVSKWLASGTDVDDDDDQRNKWLIIYDRRRKRVGKYINMRYIYIYTMYLYSIFMYMSKERYIYTHIYRSR